MEDDNLHRVVVACRNDEAYNMVSLELADPAGGDLPAFSAGSHIDVTLPGGLVRQYSLYNSPSERNRYRIGIWKDANSRGGSKAIHEQVRAGDTLMVGLPRNRFRVPRGTKRAVLMGRGIGVTPLLSIADYLKSENIPFVLHYVFAMMSPESFRPTVAASRFADSTQFYYELSTAGAVLNPAAVLAEQRPDTQLFICGADWWQDPIIKQAKEKGFPEERIHVERFTAKVPAAVLDKVFRVKLASSGIEYQISGDKTVTACLEEQGVKIPTSCEQGMCGTCMVKVIEGDIDHRDKRLSAQQKEQGYFLACVSRAKSDLLVLDL